MASPAFSEELVLLDDPSANVEAIDFNEDYLRTKRNDDHLPNSKCQDDPETVYDYVIVGSGVCGLTMAYRLLKLHDKPLPSIKVIEQDDRLGGRLWTDTFREPYPDTDNTKVMRCEEGGMRFCHDHEVMGELCQLIKDLDSEKASKPSLADQITPFPMKPTGYDGRKLWFNGTAITQWYAEANPQMWEQLFYLENDEKGKSAGQIYIEIYIRLLKENYPRLLTYFGGDKAKVDVVLSQDFSDPQLKRLQDTEYWYFFRKYCTFQEKPLYTYSFKALLVSMGYSFGCMQMLANAEGFKCFIETQGNAGVILQMCMMHEAMSGFFKHFNQGFSSLINKLKDCIDKYLGDSWYILQQSVVGIKKVSDDVKNPVFMLCSRHTKDNKSGLLFNHKAKKVILALPPKAMKEIFYEPRIPSKDQNSPSNHLQPSKIGHEAIQSVYAVRMTKINLYFNKVWWNDPISGKLYGPNTCNMPISQVYTFYAEKDEDGFNNSDIVCAITIYCDESNAQFWADLQFLGPKFTSKLQEEYSKLNPASMLVVKQAVVQLRKLFNLYDIPSPILTTYRSWDGEGLNSIAIHQWNVGADDREIMKDIIRPIKSKGKPEDIYVCNEAWSPFQGWVEGSLMATAAALKQIQQDEALH